MRLSDYYRSVPEALRKPEARETTKGRKDRYEDSVKKAVRAECVDRDGYCRVQSDDPNLLAIVGACSGLSQWAHLKENRRSKTRNMPPTVRHNTMTSGMLCSGHHDAYDARDWRIGYLTNRGADGPIRVYKGEQEYREG